MPLQIDLSKYKKKDSVQINPSAPDPEVPSYTRYDAHTQMQKRVLSHKQEETPEELERRSRLERSSQIRSNAQSNQTFSYLDIYEKQ